MDLNGILSLTLNTAYFNENTLSEAVELQGTLEIL